MKKDFERHRLERQQGLSRSNIRDFILGFQDGLVNTLGLVLGVASAVQSTRIVLISGLVTTFVGGTITNTISFIENKVIDGVPEEAIIYAEKPNMTGHEDPWAIVKFKDMKPEDQRKIISQYHQIIHYVADSLPKKP